MTSAEELATELYAQYAGSLRTYAQRLTGDRQRGEDVAQETLLKAWLYADRLVDSEAGRRAWLFRVAHNMAIDDVRHRRSRPAEVLTEAPAEGPAWSTVKAAEPDGTDDLLSTLEMTRALAGLSEEHRSVLVEIFYRGSTTREAARALRIPHGTAKSRLHYGLRHLRARLPVPVG
jgi:RNA polymerase sigma-70 factor (ECF subfamily)